MQCYQTQIVGRTVINFMHRKRLEGFEVIEFHRVAIFPNRYRVVFGKPQQEQAK
jgi:hypothetical protein